MKTIQLQIDDSDCESFLNIINNLKQGFIKKITISDSMETVSDKEQKYYENLLKNMNEDDRTISSKDTITL
ncbi:MAG: hypothetical protein PHS10_03265 [Thiovulaceae bacterium]|nr:hypothetical protein [Sulfurimonadaceae bacterium]